MLQNLLNALPEGGKVATTGQAALYALIGYLVVFAGIAFLILVVWLVGKFVTQSNAKVVKKQPQQSVSEAKAVPVEEEISEETVAVIMAAVMAYYQANNPKCEFTVKRIKRL